MIDAIPAWLFPLSPGGLGPLDSGYRATLRIARVLPYIKNLRNMDVDALIKAYATLPAVDQSMLAAVVRAHQLFNTHEWRDELARRHQRIDRGDLIDLNAVERLIRQLDTRTA